MNLGWIGSHAGMVCIIAKVKSATRFSANREAFCEVLLLDPKWKHQKDALVERARRGPSSISQRGTSPMFFVGGRENGKGDWFQICYRKTSRARWTHVKGKNLHLQMTWRRIWRALSPRGPLKRMKSKRFIGTSTLASTLNLVFTFGFCLLMAGGYIPCTSFFQVQ